MAEYGYVGTQTLQPGEVALLDEILPDYSGNVAHRKGSGIVSIFGRSWAPVSRFEVTYHANIAVATGETAGPVSLAVTLGGEALANSIGTSTPTAVGAFNSVSNSAAIPVLYGCCRDIAIRNVSDIAIDISNLTVDVDRLRF